MENNHSNNHRHELELRSIATDRRTSIRWRKLNTFTISATIEQMEWKKRGEKEGKWNKRKGNKYETIDKHSKLVIYYKLQAIPRYCLMQSN